MGEETGPPRRAGRLGDARKRRRSPERCPELASPGPGRWPARPGSICGGRRAPRAPDAGGGSGRGRRALRSSPAERGRKGSRSWRSRGGRGCGAGRGWPPTRSRGRAAASVAESRGAARNCVRPEPGAGAPRSALRAGASRPRPGGTRTCAALRRRLFAEPGYRVRPSSRGLRLSVPPSRSSAARRFLLLLTGPWK